MDREEVIRMARDAGFREDEFIGGPRKGKVSIFDFGDVDIYSNLERFAALVAAAERDRCAKVLDKLMRGDFSVRDSGINASVKAIRALT